MTLRHLAVGFGFVLAVAAGEPAAPPLPALQPPPSPAPQPPPQPPPQPTEPTLIPITPTPGFWPARPRDWWQMHQHHLDLAQEYRDAEIVLLGDSLTQGWGTKPKFEGVNKKTWETHFGRWKTLNLGIAGDKTQHILWRLENGELDGLQPRLIILAIGVNNVWNGKVPAAAVAQGVKKCVETIRAKRPEATVLVLPPFPNGEAAAHPDRRRTADINAEIAKLKLDDGIMVRTLALWREFLRPDGRFDKAVTSDFIHLTPAGYEIYATALEPVVAELLK